MMSCAAAWMWAFAISRKDCEVNEPLAVLERSTSEKLEVNQKTRQPLDIAGLQAIHEKAEPWLQIAMDQPLVTLLAHRDLQYPAPALPRGIPTSSGTRPRVTRTWPSSGLRLPRS